MSTSVRCLTLSSMHRVGHIAIGNLISFAVGVLMILVCRALGFSYAVSVLSGFAAATLFWPLLSARAKWLRRRKAGSGSAEPLRR